MGKNIKLVFQLNNKSIILLTTLNVIFFAYFIALAFFNRLSQDDLLFLKIVPNSTFLNFVKNTYLSQTGRFTCLFYWYLLMLFITETNTIFYIPILIWMINFFILRYAFSKIFINSFLSSNLSALFLNIFIITNFEFTAFYWINATYYYIQPALFLLLLFLVNQEKVSKFQYRLLLFVAILISGLSETFIPFCLLFLFLNLVYYCFKNNNWEQTIKDNKNKRILVSFVIIIIGFGIQLCAPGNYNRATEEIFQQPQRIVEFLQVSIQSFALFFYLLAFKFPYYIILILISFEVGFNNRRSIFFRFNYKLFLFFSWLGYLIFIYLSILPTSYLMSGFGFHRIYTFTVYISMIFFVIQGFVLGLKTSLKISEPLFQQLVIINLVVIIFVMSINLFLDIPVEKKYSQSDIDRTNLLLNLKNKHHTELVELEPLYKPYTYSLKYAILRKKQPMLYYINEIETDTSAFSNQCIKNYYELGFPIKLK
jgi:hypothetical protein